MFDFASKNTIQLTGNLEKIRDDLIEARELIPGHMFMTMRDTMTPVFNNIILDETENAIALVKEFDFPEFKNALINSMQMLQEGELFKLNIRGKTITTEIKESFEREFGTLEDYSNGIIGARFYFEKGDKKKFNPEKASKYWKNVIYNHRFNTTIYENTIALRLFESGQKAPFWPLLDDGVPQPISAGRGGTPHPTSAGTRFTEIAARKITALAEAELASLIETELQAIQDQITQLEKTLDSIDKIAIMARRNVEQYTEPQILAELRINNTRYFAYITGTGKLGLAQHPRFQGRRLPR